VESKIEFGDLPSGMRGGVESPHSEIAAELRARPGEWARVLTGAPPNTTTRIKKGMTVAYRPAGTFDATARSIKRNRGDIWARYVGENGEHK